VFFASEKKYLSAFSHIALKFCGRTNLCVLCSLIVFTDKRGQMEKSMSNNLETIGKLFDYAIELEKATETLYRQAGKMFSHDQDVEKFWTHLANEERGHASYLERIKQEVDINRLSDPADNQMMLDVQTCLSATSLKRLDSVQNLEDAYQLAVELENSETNAIFEFMIMNFSKDELAKSNKFLRIQLSNHLAGLETGLPGKYGSSITRRNLKIQ
jgi:hypothetical protein